MSNKFIAIDPLTEDVYGFDTEEAALTECSKLNKANPEHPSFRLHKMENGKGVYMGRLLRKFGESELFFGDESDL
jgi:hypothetical protein